MAVTQTSLGSRRPRLAYDVPRADRRPAADPEPEIVDAELVEE